EETSKPTNKDKAKGEVHNEKNEITEDESLGTERECKEQKETNVIDDILFGGDESIENLPEVGVPDLSLINELIKKPDEKTDAKSDEEEEII
ncbi:hypothetical protein FHG87_004917, partial [Trinorchestia longiramus]